MSSYSSFNPRMLLRTSAFQLAISYATVFLVSVLVLFGVLYWATIGGVSRQIDATIESEIRGLAEQYERRGVNGLVDVLNERARRSTDYGAIYLFADERGTPITGNLRRWPSVAANTDGKIEFETSLGDNTAVRYRASVLSVDRRYRLLVGRDLRELTQLNSVFERSAVWGIGFVLLLAIVGGVLMSVSAQRRVAVINRTARRIMSGDLSERVPISGARDEYDDLATNINSMLSQIEILLENVRHVGDSIAHDLKTPLTRLRNRLETLAGSSTAIPGEIEKCVADSDQLLATFNALLRIARIESGAYRAEFADVDLGEIVDGVCDLYRAAADEKDISLTITTIADTRMFGDRELLTQAFANVLDNALKYTPHNGEIRIVIDAYHGGLDLVVSDSGKGVPIEDHDRIQQRFVRLDSARSEPGNGLGLSLVKAVVEQHQGELMLANLEPGLQIRLRLPRGSADNSVLQTP